MEMDENQEEALGFLQNISQTDHAQLTANALAYSWAMSK
jgi:hypothetical protein